MNQIEEITIDLDSIIKRLLDFKSSKLGKQMQLTENQINGLIKVVRDIFMKENMLVEVTAPLKVCGDIHGQYSDLLRLLQYGNYPPQSTYLFLGDYVDRGRQGIQTICLLMAYKIQHPDKVFILRGNHQTAAITRIYGFYEECKNRYSTKLWKKFIDCFNCMPVAALIQDKILCMHGGISPQLLNIDQINMIVRPTDIPDIGILCDLLWADPQQGIKLWGQSQRGVSYVFGTDAVKNFLHHNNLELIIRAHQVVEDGYEFFASQKLVTVFSAPNYCGQFNNCGAMMRINSDLICSFQVLKPNQRLGGFRVPRPRTPLK